MFPSIARLALVALLAAPAALAVGTPSAVPVPPTRVRRFAPAEVEGASALNPVGLATRALAHNPVDAHALTNGQRLARGLPPRSPALNRRRALAPRQSATPCALSQPTGSIRVADASGNALGYVSSAANSFGEYGLATEAANALSVVLRRCESNDTPFDIEATNGLSNYPYFGAVVGFASTDDNITPGTANYVYVAGTSQIAHGPAQAAPNAFTAATGTSKDAESAVWTLNGDVLELNWVNTDGSVASGVLLRSASANAFAFTGNAATFTNTYGEGTQVTFTFVPTA